MTESLADLSPRAVANCDVAGDPRLAELSITAYLQKPRSVAACDIAAAPASLESAMVSRLRNVPGKPVVL